MDRYIPVVSDIYTNANFIHIYTTFRCKDKDVKGGLYLKATLIRCTKYEDGWWGETKIDVSPEYAHLIPLSAYEEKDSYEVIQEGREMAETIYQTFLERVFKKWRCRAI